MLLLSRRQGESIIISDNIKIKVVSLGAGKVRLGISAPKEVVVHREEVKNRIDQLKQTIPPPQPILEPPTNPV